MVKNINKIYFDKNVYDSNVESGEEIKFLGKKPVLLDFHAKWCGPCKMLTPILEELDKEYEGKIDIYKMDIEDEMEISQQFNVMSVPTLVFIPLEGKPAIQAGAPPKETLKEIIETKLLCSDTTEKKCCGGKCKTESDVKEDPVSTFNKIITKIRSVLN